MSANLNKKKDLPRRSTFGPNGGFGTKGRPIELKSNFFPCKIDVSKQRYIYHYDVEVNSQKAPERALPKKINEQVVTEFVKQYKNILFKNIEEAYDGKKNIYTSKQIPVDKIPLRERKKFEVEYSKPGGRGSEDFYVSLRYAQELNLTNIEAALLGKQNLDMTLIQALDVVLMHGFKMNDSYTNVGRNFFAKQQQRAVDLGCGKEIWFGFHQSLRACNGQMMLNLDVAATTFYKGQKLIDFSAQIVNPPPPARRDGPKPQQRPLPGRLDDKQRKILEKELKAVKIECRHGKHYRHYKIAKVIKETAKNKKFEHDGVMITVEKYFVKQYKLKLEFPDLPLVQMLPRDKNIYLPIEACYVIGGEHYKKKLNPNATADMVRSCAKPAPDRAKTIDFYARANNYSADATVSGFNIKINSKMVELKGRVLPTRKIEYGGKKTVEPRKGAWEPRNQRAIEACKIEDWAIFCCENERFCPVATIEDFGKKIIRGGQVIGVKLGVPSLRKHIRSVRELEDAFKLALNAQPPIKFIMVILGRDDFMYSRTKQLGDIYHGIHTQCIKASNLRKCNEQFIGNMWMKINAKHLGVNNIVKNPDGEKEYLLKPTIVIGADVTHPAPGDNSKPSIAAMVASMNSTCTKYFSDIRIQNHRQEMIGSVKEGGKRNLENSVVQFLKEFHRQTKGKKPEHIIYYRDGVAEGQYEEVLNTELKQLRGACSVLGSTYRPKMTIVVCQKRHHCRLFVKNDRDGEGRSMNVPAGTIVDKSITHPTDFDFYLVSHAGIQGTSRPTHYYCIFNNDPAINAESLQGLTYNLCHVYQRCARSVSLPAPVYYAHLAAKQAMEHIKDTNDNMSTYSGDSEETFDSRQIQSLQEKVTLNAKYSKLSQHYV